ncbi:IS701 family transposase [Streptomyces sp. NPDC001595]
MQRQYSGTAGRTENCQIGVFLAYASDRGRTLVDRRLYLPTSWTDDRERCRRAGIDDTVPFETKVAMAKTMVRRAIADRIPFRWVMADAAYGFSRGWRFEQEQADVFHVMATTGTTQSSAAGHLTTPPRPVSRPAAAEAENVTTSLTAPPAPRWTS